MLKARYPLERFRTLRTPFYYYETALLLQTLDTVLALTADRPGWKVHYAIKANHNPVILKLIAGSGLGADCVSGGEIQAALDAGFPPDSIVFAGVGKADWEILLGLEAGIGRFNIESTAEMRIIARLAAERGLVAPVSIRVNPDIGAHTLAGITTGLAENKFGIPMRDMEAMILHAAELPNINFVGLHFHIGSQILDMDDFIALCNRINELQDQLELHHIAVGSINVGGGLGVDYHHPDQMPIADFRKYFRTFTKFLKLRPGQTLHFELGRSVVAQCGSLITRVLYIKQGDFKKFLIVDAGMSDLIRPALYQAYHKIENITSDKPVETYDVVGPICESSDTFGKAVDLPGSARGDLMAIRSAGAYGEIMASGYNCRSLPKGYFSDELEEYVD